MGLFDKIAERTPRKWAAAMMSISALFGMRTPPEPEVVAQMQPARGPHGGMPPEEETPNPHRVTVARRNARLNPDD